ncbi:MAG: ATP-grasp domain-containing protein [Pseudomonadota bacterium]|nr:ATP-grasp domain-containing protein [Pseudomonadota bacterium]
MSNAPRILVTDAFRGSAIAIIRSLGRAGYQVIAADEKPDSAGFKSRYAHEALVYPSPEQSPEGFLEFMLEAARSRSIDLIIPVTDFAIQPLAAARASFAGLTRLALPTDDALAVVTDKSKTIRLAQSLGIPVPRTFYVDTVQEALDAARQLSWPLVLKPQSSKKRSGDQRIESFEVGYANSAAQLQQAMARYQGKCTVLLQELLQGGGYGVEFLAHQGEPLAVFAHRRLREVPLTGGVSSFRESIVPDPQMYAHAARLVRALGWTGLAMVEFKGAGTRAVLMEVNGRVWGSLPLATASGMDFPLLLARLYLDGPQAVTPQLDYRYTVGLKCRDLPRDLSWMRRVLLRRNKYPFLPIPGRLAIFRALAGMLDPRNRFDLFCLEDPWPALADMRSITRKLRKA